MQPETKFKLEVYKRLKEIGACWFEKIQQRSIRGTPDILGCRKGKFFALELKTPTGRPTKLQWLKLKDIHQAGGLARLVTENNLEEVIEELEKM